jgi:hypothetical protein
LGHLRNSLGQQQDKDEIIFQPDPARHKRPQGDGLRRQRPLRQQCWLRVPTF